MGDKQKFGLIMPKKACALKVRKNSIFNDESDDDEHAKKRPKIPQKKMIQKSSIKSESDLDPTIYEYDSIYDEMKTKQAESSRPKEAKQSRYIETLLKAADKKKREYERRIDRKIQIEREKEGDQFKDKEEFVTTSYKKKLQEKEEEEERERRENMLNDMMDVTKQKDLSGFYRHFLNQTIGEEKVPLFGEKQIKKEVESDQDLTLSKVDENLDQDSDGIEIDNEDDDSERDFISNEKLDEQEKKKKTFRKRMDHYRDNRKISRKQRSDDSKLEDVELSQSPKPHKTCIRKSSINSNSDINSSDDEDNEAAKKSLYSEKNKKKGKRNINKSNSRHDSSSSDDEHSNKSVNLQREVKEGNQKREAKEEKQRNIYAKRTVGDVFADAQARYFQRMAMRNS